MPDQELVAAAATAADHPAPSGAAPVARQPGTSDQAVTGPAVAGSVPPEADGLVVQRGLDDLELAVLDLERRTYRHQGAKEQAVRDELDLSATRYYQVLNALLDDPAALAREPVLVGRARRLRDERLARGAQ